MKNPEIKNQITKSNVVAAIFSQQELAKENLWQAKKEKGLGYAPANIALCKYWGKRDNELNLPMTSSLSVALPDKGALTTISLTHQENDVIVLNDENIPPDSEFAQRTIEFLNLFRPNDATHFQIDIHMTIPVAAGLASSACGFASLICALNDLYDWQLSLKNLSILARLGSGSAARSLWNGFVEWHAGLAADGMDSFGEPIEQEWPALRIGILTISNEKKPLSSRAAMLDTVNTSMLYESWVKKATKDLSFIKQAIKIRNFSLLGGTAESNALAMHATMLSSWPPICYYLPETIAAMHHIWELRRKGLEVYFTQDAGPNLKLLFLEESKEKLLSIFPQMEVISLF